MLGWVSSWWSVGSFTGPARNAPNNGIDIKKLFDQRPTQVILLSETEVKQELKKLRPTKTNAVPPLSTKPPLMQEFDDVFNKGYKDYFEARKNKRIKVETLNTVIIAVVDVPEMLSNTDSISQQPSNQQPNVTFSEPSLISDPIDNTETDSLTKSEENITKSEYILSKDEILAELDDFQNI